MDGSEKSGGGASGIRGLCVGHSLGRGRCRWRSGIVAPQSLTQRMRTRAPATRANRSLLSMELVLVMTSEVYRILILLGRRPQLPPYFLKYKSPMAGRAHSGAVPRGMNFLVDAEHVKGIEINFSGYI